MKANKAALHKIVRLNRMFYLMSDDTDSIVLSLIGDANRTFVNNIIFVALDHESKERIIAEGRLTEKYVTTLQELLTSPEHKDDIYIFSVEVMKYMSTYAGPAMHTMLEDLNTLRDSVYDLKNIIFVALDHESKERIIAEGRLTAKYVTTLHELLSSPEHKDDIYIFSVEVIKYMHTMLEDLNTLRDSVHDLKNSHLEEFNELMLKQKYLRHIRSMLVYELQRKFSWLEKFVFKREAYKAHKQLVQRLKDKCSELDRDNFAFYMKKNNLEYIDSADAIDDAILTKV